MGSHTYLVGRPHYIEPTCNTGHSQVKSVIGFGRPPVQVSHRVELPARSGCLPGRVTRRLVYMSAHAFRFPRVVTHQSCLSPTPCNSPRFAPTGRVCRLHRNSVHPTTLFTQWSTCNSPRNPNLLFKKLPISLCLHGSSQNSMMFKESSCVY